MATKRFREIDDDDYPRARQIARTTATSYRAPFKMPRKMSVSNVPFPRRRRRSTRTESVASYARSSLWKIVHLSYQDTTGTVVTVAAGSTFNYNQYRCNSAFDVNPSIASTSMPGFQEWASFYLKYLVTWCKITCTFVNTSQSACYAGIAFRPYTSEATWTTWTAWRQLEGNSIPHKVRLLSMAGGQGDRVTLSVKAPLWKIVGNFHQYNSDVAYQAVVTTNPSNIIDGFVYVLTGDGAVGGATNPIVTVKVNIQMYVRFFNKRLQLS